jgi:excisionase family DNA binding protein
MKGEEFVGSCEAAQILGKTPDTVRLMARKGTLKAVIVTRHGRLYRRADVEALAQRAQK